MSSETSPLLNYRLYNVAGGFAESCVAASQEEVAVSQQDDSRKLSTFFGVVVPTVLSMFSIVIFMRVGFVIGQAGFLQSLLMLVVAYIIVSLTVLSVCAISTNGAVKGGGAYFMISRTLGPEFGGSIGLMFFLANVCSCAVYILGLVEAILDVFGELPNAADTETRGIHVLPQNYLYDVLYASSILFLCLLVCLVGAQIYARTSFLIFLVVHIVLITIVVSFFAVSPKTILIVKQSGNESRIIYTNYTGFSTATLKKNLMDDYSVDYTTNYMMTFATVFAVMFNGCTGIMAGSNMSGDLKNPSYSIPKGTVIAVIYTFLVYLLLFFLVSFTCDRALLKGDYIFFRQINVWPPFVVIGVYAASLSASMSTLIGASRILHALARDDLFGVILAPAKRTSMTGNPWVAVLYTWLMVQSVLFAGKLNTIAGIVTIFFLMAYAAVDLACLALEWASAPNFRPTFQLFSWHTCLLGIISCLVMMFLINPAYASCGIVVMLILLVVIHYRSPTSSWGYISQALIFHQVRKYLLLLDIRKEHVKFWRPQILLMVANPRTSAQLITFINDLKKGGLFVLGHVEIGDLGGMKPNTLVLGFYDHCVPEDYFLCDPAFKDAKENDHFGVDIASLQAHFPPVRDGETSRSLTEAEYVAIISDALKMQKNVCLARYFFTMNKKDLFAKKRPERVSIDVWPLNLLRPDSTNYVDMCSLFLLQMACVLTMVVSWKGARLRIFLCIESGDDSWIKKEEKLRELLDKLRIKATIKIVTWDDVVSLHWQSRLSGEEHEAARHSSGDPSALISDEYLRAANRMVLDQGFHTAVRFLYLPRPPADAARSQRYLEQLDILTEGLGPTLLIHGLTPVTCTDL
ncbi:solute carrier family 12 member 9 isoform X3 [Carcharodon carcharias]|uniref:solute carrier family 12 member 9 isoform X3 n=1 Tax=Carcharodon carcharias TaxID=13397 RepID=UPI001B7DEC55|nr:solute carrier family 12 member 9 isoform X3 [Carcharodon carcharias]